VNMTKVHYIHVWKYHNETPYFVQLIYTNKSKLLGKSQNN
jgi:hypothetical protein